MILELLREPGDARWLFYVAVMLGLIGVYRFSLQLAVVIIGTAAFGVVAREIASRIDDTWINGVLNEGGRLERISDWVIIPEHVENWVKPVAYISLIAALLALTVIRGWARIILLVPTLYLAAFVWENVMLQRPEATRYIILGAMLIALMIIRPTGLLGEKRVEII